jgi:hypothetical protein
MTISHETEKYGTKNYCAGKDQQQFTRPISFSWDLLLFTYFNKYFFKYGAEGHVPGHMYVSVSDISGL